MATNLADQKCVPCRGGTPPLTPEQIAPLLTQLDGWKVEDDKKLIKSFKVKDFVAAIDFVNRITPVAEAEGHHPDLYVRWGEVRVYLWTHLVLIAHTLVTPGNAIYKGVATMERDKRARILRCEPPRRSDRAGWVRKLAEGRGLTITPGAVRLLLERSQPDLRLLDQEIAKLALYVVPATRIDEEAVRALVSDTREEEIFALTDALAGGRPGEVAGVLQSLLESGREPTWMLYTLVSHWRRLMQARAVRDRGGTVADLQARLTDHPFVIEKAFRQAADYTAAELDRGFHELLRMEEQIKLGELDARLAVEGFILEQVLTG